MFDATPIYDPKKLLEAINRAEINLREVLKDRSIKLVLIDEADSNNQTRRQYSQQWRNDNPLNWNTYFDELEKKSEQFVVAIYKKETLCGLCLYDIRDILTKKERLRIHSIERNKSHNYLKGYLITAYSQIGIEVSQNLGITSLSVLSPEPNTVRCYLRIGFKKSSHVEFDLPVTKDTKTKLDATFEYLNSKLQHATP